MEKIIQMLFVIALMGFFVFSAGLDARKDKAFKIRLLYSSVFLISIFLAFQNIGLDIEPYKSIFDGVEPSSPTEALSLLSAGNSLEPGFYLAISTMKNFGLGFNFFLFLSAIVPMFFIAKMTIAHSERPLTAFCIFILLQFLIGPVTTIRHFFAATLYIYALHLFSNAKNKKGWLISLISICFHYSNLSLVLTNGFAKRLKFTRSVYIATLTLSVASGYTLSLIVKTIDLSSIQNFGGVITYKAIYYLTYMNSANGYEYLNTLHQILLSVVHYFPLIVIIYYNIISLGESKSRVRDEFSRLNLNSQIIGTTLACFFLSFGAIDLGVRLNFLLSLGAYLQITECIYKRKGDNPTNRFLILLYALIAYNIIVILYFAGIFNPLSPFSIV